MPKSKSKLPPRSFNQNSNHVKLSLYNSSLISKLMLVLSLIPKLTHALPIAIAEQFSEKTLRPESNENFMMYLVASAILVLLGGVFAGLTLGLMGQDEIYLKVISNSGTPLEQYYANKVLKLLGRGKHWVLVTLLLSNVITNETLPVVLDRCLGGGLVAVFASTVSIVIFGEIIPQSVCVRYGLELGAYFSPFVLCLMYLMYPVAYPILLLLDSILGQDHGTVYKKSGLKTLVTLHRTMGVERLNQDEVTIISAVLDLKEKPVGSIMTPIDKVYTMSADTILDEKAVDNIFNSGFSRIPIHLPGEPTNFTGMLLVRVLISYDPEDALPVASFPLATLPETSEDTSCLNILNYFQEGKSHMVVVSETPGMPSGAKGVLTLEDVIEELIGEEIVDESDVYIDLNKNIKRHDPGPLSKRNLSTYLHNVYATPQSQRGSVEQNRDAKHLSPFNDTNLAYYHKNAAKPSNLASNPLETNKAFVTIKKQPEDALYKIGHKDSPVVNRELSPGYGATTNDKKFILPNDRSTPEADISTIALVSGDEQDNDVEVYINNGHDDELPRKVNDLDPSLTVAPSSYKLINHNRKTIICAIDDEDETAHAAHSVAASSEEDTADNTDDEMLVPKNKRQGRSKLRTHSFMDYITGNSN